jgi:predicted metal-dependent HD superfamily phosphohydrolase
MKINVETARKYVTALLKEKLSREYIYHNIEHAEEVARSGTEIALNSGFSPDEVEIVQLAAWFHDTGFIHGCADHEEKSSEILTEFFNTYNLNDTRLPAIKELISVTDLSKKPSNLPEKVIRDADILLIGKQGFYEKSFLLKSEWENTGCRKFNELEWIKSSLTFLINTTFFTEYAQSKYEPGRQINISQLTNFLNEHNR